jgi:hypothetical protein
MAKDEDLSVYWDELFPPRPPREPTLLERVSEEGALAIGTSKHVLVVIDKTGELHYGDGYTPDGAARAFWEAMAAQRRNGEEHERELLIAHMEGILTALGAADLHNQAVQLRLAEQQTTENFVAAQAGTAALERAVSQAIELGRGLCHRPEVARVPLRVPRHIQEDPENSYEGQEGLGEQPYEGVPEALADHFYDDI